MRLKIHLLCCSQVIKAILEEQGAMRTVTFKLGSSEHKYEVTKVDVLKDKVSVNIPYQRFLAGLMPSFNAFGDGKKKRESFVFFFFSPSKDLYYLEKKWKTKNTPTNIGRDQLIAIYIVQDCTTKKKYGRAQVFTAMKRETKSVMWVSVPNQCWCR